MSARKERLYALRCKLYRQDLIDEWRRLEKTTVHDVGIRYSYLLPECVKMMADLDSELYMEWCAGLRKHLIRIFRCRGPHWTPISERQMWEFSFGLAARR